MALLTRADRDLIAEAAKRIEDLCDKWQPHTYDYGNQTLIRDLRELADRP